MMNTQPAPQPQGPCYQGPGQYQGYARDDMRQHRAQPPVCRYPPSPQATSPSNYPPMRPHASYPPQPAPARPHMNSYYSNQTQAPPHRGHYVEDTLAYYEYDYGYGYESQYGDYSQQPTQTPSYQGYGQNYEYDYGHDYYIDQGAYANINSQSEVYEYEVHDQPAYDWENYDYQGYGANYDVAQRA